MSAVIIDGKQIAAEVKADVAKKVAGLKEKGIVPCLAVVLVGDKLKYTITVKNVGLSDATLVNVTDVVDSSLVEVVTGESSPGYGSVVANGWRIASLSPGQSATLILVVKINAAGTIKNTVAVNSSENKTPVTNNSDDVDADPFVNLTVSKSVNVTVQDVVLVGGADQLIDRQTHQLGKVSGENVAEVARGNGHVHLFAHLQRALGKKVAVGRNVIYDLRCKTAPVDGVGTGEEEAVFFSLLCKRINSFIDRFSHFFFLLFCKLETCFFSIFAHSSFINFSLNECFFRSHKSEIIRPSFNTFGSVFTDIILLSGIFCKVEACII